MIEWALVRTTFEVTLYRDICWLCFVCNMLSLVVVVVGIPRHGLHVFALIVRVLLL